MNWQEKTYSYPLPTRYILGPDQGEGPVEPKVCELVARALKG